jgi:transposase InsO family protein
MGHLNGRRYLLHHRDAKFCAEFQETLAAAGVKCLRLPPRSPNLNAFAERWVRSVKEECLSHLILFGERSLRKALIQFQEHYQPIDFSDITRPQRMVSPFHCHQYLSVIRSL